jgi:hypothetical protein
MFTQHWTKLTYYPVCETISSKLATSVAMEYSLILISAYKSSSADMLLAERGRIDNSHQMTDDILAYVRAPYFFLTILINSQTSV